MDKKLLEENTKKRWKKLAGIREAKTPYNFNARLQSAHAAAGGRGQTSGRTPEEVKKEQIEKIRPKLKDALLGKLQLEDEQFEFLLGMIHGNRSSNDLHKKEAPEVTSDEIIRRLSNIGTAIEKESDPEKLKSLNGLFNKISTLKHQIEKTKKALEEPLTAEEEAGLSDPSADLSLSSLSTDLRTIAGERDLPKQKRQDITTMPGPRGGFMNEGKQPKKKK